MGIAELADARSPRSVRLLWVVIGSVLLLCLSAVLAYVAHDRIERQRGEISILVQELAVTTVQRDDLQATRDRLTGELQRTVAERNRTAEERDRERSRAEQAEASVTELTGRLGEANARLVELQSQAESSAAEVKRLEADLATLRSRTQAAQADARDASAAAAAANAARQREAAVASAALAYADAGAALSRTRNRMIDILREQIAAERAGRYSTASLLVSEYNGLVSVHNRQVEESNTALARLRNLLN
jgi:chromosome segregation ATPase